MKLLSTNVTLSMNVEKNIWVVVYVDPKIGKKTTKSLGKMESISRKEALKIKEAMEFILNKSDYYKNYNNFKEAKNNCKNETIKKAFELIFKGNDNWKKEMREKTIIEDKNFIEITNFTNEFCYNNSFVFVGLPGAGKTQTIQQLIGSIEYNTPACTASNTTTGGFYAKINNKKYLKLSALMIEELSERISDNFDEFIMFCVYNDKLSKHNLLKKLLTSNDLKCNLLLLLSENEKVESCLQNLSEDICGILKNAWEKFYKFYKDEKKASNEKIELINEFISLINKEPNYNYIINKEQLEIINEIDKNKYVKKICNYIYEAEINLINKMYKDLINESDKINASLDFKYFTDENTICNKPIVSKNSNIIAIQFKLEYKDSNKSVDKDLRKVFFNAMTKISCGENKSNLRPVVSSLKIEGNFQPKIKVLSEILNENKEMLIIDSEGIGHNAGNLSYSSRFAQNIQYAKKVIWIIDINSPINSSHKDMLKILTSNGCLYKTELAFSKCDSYLDNIDGDLEQRRFELIENLYKELENNEEIYNSRNLMLEKAIFIGDLNKNIDGQEIKFKFRNKVIKDSFNKEYEKGLKNLFNLYKTNQDNELSFEYNFIQLNDILNKEVEQYLDDYKRNISLAFWSKIKALTRRMTYSLDDRGYKKFRPEDDLKARLKQGLQKIINNPIKINNKNISEEDKALYYNEFQIIQEILGKNIDNIVTDLIYYNNEDNWRRCYEISGNGSGNRRKQEVKDLLEKSLQYNNENKVLNELCEKLEKLEIQKPFNVKFSICNKSIFELKKK